MVRHPAHVAFGVLAVYSYLISDVLPVLCVVLYLTYQIKQDIYSPTRDSHKDIMEFAVAFAVGIAVMLIMKVVGLAIY